MKLSLRAVLVYFMVGFGASNALAQPGVTQTIPTSTTGGASLDLPQILGFILDSGNYIFTVAGIVMAIGFVVSGILYMSAGTNTSRVASAKAYFKYTAIGAIIIFGIGTILSTIKVLVETPGSFFS